MLFHAAPSCRHNRIAAAFRSHGRYFHASNLARVPNQRGVAPLIDIGRIETYVPPKNGLAELWSRPRELIKALFHKVVINQYSLAVFRRTIKPQRYPTSLIVSHARQLRDDLRLACVERDISRVRQLCSPKLQSDMVRHIKNLRRSEASAPAVTNVQSKGASLVSFKHLTINMEGDPDRRRKRYVQAIVRVVNAQGKPEDVTIVSKAWERPLTWTIETLK